MKVLTKLSIILAVNFLLFSLVIILLEGSFRILGIPYKVAWIPNENALAKFDSELGWSYIPDKSTTQKIKDKIIPVHFDRNGIRVPYSNFQFKTSDPSILFIGDSFTFGHGLSYEESFVGKFASLKEIPYQVVNLGVQGYGSDQALLALKKYLPMFNTKIVVYTFIEDHIKRNNNYDRRLLMPTAMFLGTKPLFALNKKGELYLSKKPLLYKDYVHSYLIDFLKIRIGPKLGPSSYPEELTKAIILEMKRISEENGVHFVVVNWRWTKNDYDRLFKDLDADVIDTMEDAPKGWEKMVVNGGIHPDAQAGDHVVQLLLKYFQKKGILQNDQER